MRKKSKEKYSIYVLYGFNKDNPEETGYLEKLTKTGGHLRIVTELSEAQRYTSENIFKIKGFGTPKQWLKYWNTEPGNRYKFHLVKVTTF